MKTNKYIEKLGAKSTTELREALISAKKKFFSLRFQNAASQLDSTVRINGIRKNIARIQTVITEQAGA